MALSRRPIWKKNSLGSKILRTFLHKRVTMSLISCRQVTLCNNFDICLFIFINFLPVICARRANSKPSLSFAIPQFNLDTSILYEGDATPSLGMVELNTVSQLFRVGRFTYSKPLHLWESASGLLTDFTTHFTFMIDTQNNSRWIGFPIPPNSAGGNLGLFNSSTNFVPSKNQIVMVEFDSFSNEWDPTVPHVGINVNKIFSIVSTSWDFSSNKWKVANAWITYNATTKYLSEDPDHNVGRSSLSYVVDLRKVLPERVTTGFSAATGAFNERHVIYSWDFTSSLDSDSKKKGIWRPILIAVAVTSVVVVLGVAIWWVVTDRRSSTSTRTGGSGNTSNHVPPTQNLQSLSFPKEFSYQELFEATNGFADENRLGQGASAHVYKGTLKDLAFPVAVKKFFAESEQYESLFINEVTVIRRVMHRNLVQFVGWCYEQAECFLVYAYMPNGSLDMHLFGPRTTLQWDRRYDIAIGLALALHYLHEGAEQCVLHRDIKAANILLDNDFKTKLGDFGVAKLVDPQSRSRTHHTTRVAGTHGYIAPEYANEGRASKESDMFSFGVVALEIACGRKPYLQGESFQGPLYEWVWQLYVAGNLLGAADEALRMDFDQYEMERLLMVGLWCTHYNKERRPKAGEVVKVLQLEAPLPELPEERPHHPLPFHPLQQVAESESHVSITSSFNTSGR
ncbi:unnamed protein product [Malus baccata var. baccata]